MVGRKDVTTAFTAERLVPTSTETSYVILTADHANTASLVVGDSSAVDALAASRTGAVLMPGESTGISVQDLYDIWVDVQVNGEGVSYFAKSN